MDKKTKMAAELLKKIKPTGVYNDKPLQYNHIKLEDEERDEALRIAREAKHLKIETEKYWNKVNNPPKPPVLTAKSMKNMVVNLAKSRFNIDFKVGDKSIFNSLLSYFCDEVESLNPSKGIMLQGGVGIGKTTLMKLFSKNQKSSFIIVSCRTVAAEYASGGADGKGGYKAIEKYFKPWHTAINEFGHTELGICFDDLGTEDDKKNFGNSLNVMSEIILNRYDNPELDGKTHFTTNLDSAEIEEIYGTRVRSRLREMINPIKFEGAKDLRK